LKGSPDDCRSVPVVEAPKCDITESDLFTGLDGLLGEEDLDPVVMIVPVGGGSVVHLRKTETHYLKIKYIDFVELTISKMKKYKTVNYHKRLSGQADLFASP
jgi:hypothetical protein